MKKRSIFILFSLILAANICAETEGEKFFKNNNPQKAVACLEKEIASGNITADSYNFLGLAYSQLGKYEDAVDAFGRGLNNSKSNKKIIAFNRGNAYYSLGKYGEAAGCYSLAMAADPSFTKALLNRGNAYLMKQDYDNVILDYEKYLLLEPDDPQKIQIEEILALLKRKKVEQAEKEKKEAEEALQLAREQEKIQKEIERQQEEKKAAEIIQRQKEEERKRKLLEEVANSLQNSDSTNLSSGAEDIIDYDYESELD